MAADLESSAKAASSKLKSILELDKMLRSFSSWVALVKLIGWVPVNYCLIKAALHWHTWRTSFKYLVMAAFISFLLIVWISSFPWAEALKWGRSSRCRCGWP